jgi:hypothetical protein
VFVREDLQHDAVQNAAALGAVEQLDRILGLDHERLEETLKEGVEDGN